MKPKAARVFWATTGVQRSLTSHSSDIPATRRAEYAWYPFCSQLWPWNGPILHGQGKGQYNWGWCYRALLAEITSPRWDPLTWASFPHFTTISPPWADTNYPLPAATTDPYPATLGAGVPLLASRFPLPRWPWQPPLHTPCVLCPPLHSAPVASRLMDQALSWYPSHEAAFCESHRATSNPQMARLTLLM